MRRWCSLCMIGKVRLCVGDRNVCGRNRCAASIDNAASYGRSIDLCG